MSLKRYDDDHSSVVDIVDSLINCAIDLEASDIHVEPSEKELQIRFRIDGILQVQSSLPAKIQQQIVSRLKVLAQIDIAENRLPQDGKIRFDTKKASVDLRVSTFPSRWGQKVVIRILDRDYNFLQFDQLGLDKKTYKAIKGILDKPQGLFLVTGPTGSGKTTTLYALLSYLNTTERNIVTLEDPVEYEIEGITQGHIVERVGFGFAQGVRSVLRQDPDIIMIGEIRDVQTAKTAIQAALTGHLVLSTLHTNDAPSSVMRLIDMGIAPYLINAALSGTLAQRLVRQLCPACKKRKKASQDVQKVLKQLGVRKEFLYESIGCKQCNQIGYKSRVGIFEYMPMNDYIRALIDTTLNLDNLRKASQKAGMHLLKDEASAKMCEGIISLDEYLRVV